MKQSILVVDDEASIRELLARWLEADGYEVREAETAERALELMSERRSMVVMCDIEMPGHGGLWLAEQLRERFAASAMVLATGIDSIPPATSLKSGIVEYLVKPFERTKVMNAVAAGVSWHLAETERAKHPEPERGSVSEWLDSSLGPDK